MKKIIKIEPSAVGKILMRKRVAAYCRVSSGKEEQLESLEAQKAHYEEYISSNPEWEYAGLYYDEGITGRRKDLRPALMQMMQDCEWFADFRNLASRFTSRKRISTLRRWNLNCCCQ